MKFYNIKFHMYVVVHIFYLKIHLSLPSNNEKPQKREYTDNVWPSLMHSIFTNANAGNINNEQKSCPFAVIFKYYRLK